MEIQMGILTITSISIIPQPVSGQFPICPPLPAGHNRLYRVPKCFSAAHGNGSGPAAVDVYDICSNTWSKLFLTDRRGCSGAGAAGGKVLIAGGAYHWYDAFVKTVDIFNLGPLIAQ